jgi:hypothetical protein
MKSLKFEVIVEGLPDTTKNYRAQGSVCYAVTRELRGIYGDPVNVIVKDPETSDIARALRTLLGDPVNVIVKDPETLKTVEEPLWPPSKHKPFAWSGR